MRDVQGDAIGGAVKSFRVLEMQIKKQEALVMCLIELIENQSRGGEIEF